MVLQIHRFSDLNVNKYDMDSFQGVRHCGGNSGNLSIGAQATGIGRKNYGEPATWYYIYLGSRNSWTILLINTILIHIKGKDILVEMIVH